MPRSDTPLQGLGARSLVPRLVAGVNVLQLKLTPEQAFVLSRVDGRTTLGQIVSVVPFPEAQTAGILRALHDDGVLEVPGLTRAPTPTPSPSVAPSPPPERQRKETPGFSKWIEGEMPLALDLDHIKPPPPEPASHTVTPTAVDAENTGKVRLTPGVPPLHRRTPTPRPATADGIDLAPETRRRVDDALAAANAGDAAALLGVGRGVDERELRRAYFKLAKEFHPDRFYGKDLGPYRPKLELLFAAITDAFNKLLATAKR